MNTIFLVATLLLMLGCETVPRNSRCPASGQACSALFKDRFDYEGKTTGPEILRAIIKENLRAPQENLSINLGSLSTYLKNPMRAEVLDVPFTEQELGAVRRAMEKAHAAYGIKTEVDQGDWYSIAYTFFGISLKKNLFDLIGSLAPDLVKDVA